MLINSVAFNSCIPCQYRQILELNIANAIEVYLKNISLKTTYSAFSIFYPLKEVRIKVFLR